MRTRRSATHCAAPRRWVTRSCAQAERLRPVALTTQTLTPDALGQQSITIILEKDRVAHAVELKFGSNNRQTQPLWGHLALAHTRTKYNAPQAGAGGTKAGRGGGQQAGAQASGDVRSRRGRAGAGSQKPPVQKAGRRCRSGAAAARRAAARLLPRGSGTRRGAAPRQAALHRLLRRVCVCLCVGGAARDTGRC